VTSRGTENFWLLYRKLPDEVKEAARRAHEKFRGNPAHPGLQLKQTYFNNRCAVTNRGAPPPGLIYYRRPASRIIARTLISALDKSVALASSLSCNSLLSEGVKRLRR